MNTDSHTYSVTTQLSTSSIGWHEYFVAYEGTDEARRLRAQHIERARWHPACTGYTMEPGKLYASAHTPHTPLWCQLTLPTPPCHAVDQLFHGRRGGLSTQA